jgi:tRNA(Leu) C34 or U34 (ribose-2'-O)-methylase TrmL
MKVGDIVQQVCRYSGEKIPRSTSVITAVYNWPGNEQMDLLLFHNLHTGMPQRMARQYQEHYEVVIPCKQD